MISFRHFFLLFCVCAFTCRLAAQSYDTYLSDYADLYAASVSHKLWFSAQQDTAVKEQDRLPDTLYYNLRTSPYRKNKKTFDLELTVLVRISNEKGEIIMERTLTCFDSMRLQYPILSQHRSLHIGVTLVSVERWRSGIWPLRRTEKYVRREQICDVTAYSAVGKRCIRLPVRRTCFRHDCNRWEKRRVPVPAFYGNDLNDFLVKTVKGFQY